MAGSGLSGEWLAVTGTVVLTLVLTLGLGVVLVPDAALYLDSGAALFPSPLGTALGSALGLSGLAVLHSLAVGGIVVLALSRRPSSRAWLASAPLLWWLVPLGMDALAALFLLGAIVLDARWNLWVAVGLHIAALPIAVAVALTSARGRVGVLGSLVVAAGIAAVMLLGTVYGAAFPKDGKSLLIGAAVAGLVVLLGLAPAAVAGVAPGSGGLVVAVAGGTFFAALYGAQADVTRGADFGLILFAASRYGLPVTLCGLILSRGGVERGAPLSPWPALSAGHPDALASSPVTSAVAVPSVHTGERSGLRLLRDWKET